MKRRRIIDNPGIENAVAECVLNGGKFSIVDDELHKGFPPVVGFAENRNSFGLYTVVDFKGRWPYEEVIKGILSLQKVEESIRSKKPDYDVLSYIILTNSPVKHWTELFKDPLFVTMYNHYFPQKEVNRNRDPAAAVPIR